MPASHFPQKIRYTAVFAQCFSPCGNYLAAVQSICICFGMASLGQPVIMRSCFNIGCLGTNY